ncbi:MAG: hypothetical protein J7J11_04215 [Desulfurococcales archaeon]|nr:hypothetical protein [Desulfurococcales archaeon]
MSGKEKIKKRIPVVELGLSLDGISEEDLEELAIKVSEELGGMLNELVGRRNYYITAIELEFDDHKKVINATLEVEVSTATEPSPELIAKVDTILDECFKVLRSELIKKFKNIRR